MRAKRRSTRLGKDLLRRLVNGAAPFALSSFTLGGFLRIVTNAKIFDPPTPMGDFSRFRGLRWRHPLGAA